MSREGGSNEGECSKRWVRGRRGVARREEVEERKRRGEERKKRFGLARRGK